MPKSQDWGILLCLFSFLEAPCLQCWFDSHYSWFWVPKSLSYCGDTGDFALGPPWKSGVGMRKQSQEQGKLPNSHSISQLFMCTEQAASCFLPKQPGSSSCTCREQVSPLTSSLRCQSRVWENMYHCCSPTQGQMLCGIQAVPGGWALQLQPAGAWGEFPYGPTQG